MRPADETRFQQIYDLIARLQDHLQDEAFTCNPERVVAAKKAIAALFMVWKNAIPAEQRARYQNEIALLGNVAAHNNLRAGYAQAHRTEGFVRFVQDVLDRVGRVMRGESESLPEVTCQWVREPDINLANRVELIGELARALKTKPKDWIDSLAYCFDLVRLAELQLEKKERARENIVLGFMEPLGLDCQSLASVIPLRQQIRHMTPDVLGRFLDALLVEQPAEDMLTRIGPELLTVDLSQICDLIGRVAGIIAGKEQEILTYAQNASMWHLLLTKEDEPDVDDADKYKLLVEKRRQAQALLKQSNELVLLVNACYQGAVTVSLLVPHETQIKENQLIAELTEKGVDREDTLQELAPIVETITARALQAYGKGLASVFTTLNDNNSPLLLNFIATFAKKLVNQVGNGLDWHPFLTLCLSCVPVEVLQCFIAQADLKLVPLLHETYSDGSIPFIQMLAFYEVLIVFSSKEDYLRTIHYLLDATFLKLDFEQQNNIFCFVLGQVLNDEIALAIVSHLFKLKPELLTSEPEIKDQLIGKIFVFSTLRPDLITSILRDPSLVLDCRKSNPICFAFGMAAGFVPDQHSAGLFRSLDAVVIKTPARTVSALMDRPDIVVCRGEEGEEGTLQRVISQLREVERVGKLDMGIVASLKTLICHPKIDPGVRLTKNLKVLGCVSTNILVSLLKGNSPKLAVYFVEAVIEKYDGDINAYLDSVAITYAEPLKCFALDILRILDQEANKSYLDFATGLSEDEASRKAVKELSKVRQRDSFTFVGSGRQQPAREVTDKILAERIDLRPKLGAILAKLAGNESKQGQIARAVLAYASKRKPLIDLCKSNQAILADPTREQQHARAAKFLATLEQRLAAIKFSDFYDHATAGVATAVGPTP